MSSDITSLVGQDSSGHQWKMDLAFDQGLEICQIYLDNHPLELGFNILGPWLAPDWRKDKVACLCPSQTLMQACWNPGMEAGKLFAHCQANNWEPPLKYPYKAYFETWIDFKGLHLKLSYRCETECFIGWFAKKCPQDILLCADAFEVPLDISNMRSQKSEHSIDAKKGIRCSDIAQLDHDIILTSYHGQLQASHSNFRILALTPSTELSFSISPQRSMQWAVATTLDLARPKLSASTLELVLLSKDVSYHDGSKR